MLYNPGRTYDDAVREAQKQYPGKAGKKERHHPNPKYGWGDANGPTARIDAAYHQVITNAFRTEFKYGKKPPKDKWEEFLRKIYKDFPLPPPTAC